MHWGALGWAGATPRVLLGSPAAWGKELNSQRNQLAPSQPPSAAANALSNRPAKGGVWPARGVGGGQAGEIPSISPLAAGNRFQEFRSLAARTPSREGSGLPSATLSWD